MARSLPTTPPVLLYLLQTRQQQSDHKHERDFPSSTAVTLYALRVHELNSQLLPVPPQPALLPFTAPAAADAAALPAPKAARRFAACTSTTHLPAATSQRRIAAIVQNCLHAVLYAAAFRDPVRFDRVTLYPTRQLLSAGAMHALEALHDDIRQQLPPALVAADAGAGITAKSVPLQICVDPYLYDVFVLVSDSGVKRRRSAPCEVCERTTRS